MYCYPFQLLLKTVQGTGEMALELRQLVFAENPGGCSIYMGANNRLVSSSRL